MLSLPTLPCSSHKLVWPQQASHAVFSQTLLQLPMAATLQLDTSLQLPLGRSMLSLPTLPCSSHKLVWPQQASHAVFSQTLLQLPMAATLQLDTSLQLPLGRSMLSLRRFQAAVQCLFMEVQGCRLTGLKTRQTSLQLAKPSCSSQWPRQTCPGPRQTFPAAPTSL